MWSRLSNAGATNPPRKEDRKMTRKRYDPLRVISRDGRDVTDEAIPATYEDMTTLACELVPQVFEGHEPVLSRFSRGWFEVERRGHVEGPCRAYDPQLGTWGEVVKSFRAMPVMMRQIFERAARRCFEWYEPAGPIHTIADRPYIRSSVRRRFWYEHTVPTEKTHLWAPDGFAILLALVSGMRVVWRPKNKRRALAGIPGTLEDSRGGPGKGWISDGEILNFIREANTTGRLPVEDFPYPNDVNMLAKAGVVDLVGCIDEVVDTDPALLIVSNLSDDRDREWRTVRVSMGDLMQIAKMRGIHAQAMEILIQGDE